MNTYLDGKLLVAPPKMTDWRFAKSVVYVWKHDVSGAGGIIINKKLQAPNFENICIEGKINKLKSVNPPVFYGGPIMPNLVGCLHSLDYKLPTTNIAPNEIGFTLDKRIIDDIALNKGPSRYVITIGVSSWTAGQLDEEIKSLPPRKKTGSWLHLEYNDTKIFGANTETLWSECVGQCVVDATKKITNKVFKD
jgi:putative transcriptional regulator